MVPLEGETSNTFFSVMEDWGAYIKAENIDIPSLLDKASTQQEESSISTLSTIFRTASLSQLEKRNDASASPDGPSSAVEGPSQ